MADSPRMELRRLRWIMHHVEKLSPAGRRWLFKRLREVECVDLALEYEAQRDARPWREGFVRSDGRS